MNNCWKLVPNAKMSAGIDMVTMRIEKMIRGPYLSIRAPITMRAGMVSATLQMARTLMCSLVSQPMERSIVVASGAMLNQT